jgi:predicted ATP-grasp superfamily ATP-dependent carboligase
VSRDHPSRLIERPGTGRRGGGHGTGTGAVVIGGDYQGLGIVRSLGRAGVPVIVLDDEVSISRASRFSRCTVRARSLRDEPATLQALSVLRERHGLQGWVLYPTREETVAALARNRSRLTPWFRIPTPEWDVVRHAWDKRATYTLAQRLGVATPRTWLNLGHKDVEQVDMRGPVIVKPAIKEHFIYHTGAKAWRADTLHELRRRFQQAADIVGEAEVIIQELVPGDGAQQFSYCALFKNGTPLATMTVQRRRQHPSDFGRASTFVETVALPPIEKPSIRFLQAIGYYGLVELEYKLDPRDGQYKLLDVNARTWGYHSLGRAAGVDFPYLLYRDELGYQQAPVRARPGVRWIRLATDVPNAVVDVRAGRLRARDYLRSLRGIDVEAVFDLQDPLPGAYELTLLPYLFFKRGL